MGVPSSHFFFQKTRKRLMRKDLAIFCFKLSPKVCAEVDAGSSELSWFF